LNFLKNIFKSEPKLAPISLSTFGTDIHSHLIPGIDDGSKDMEDSISMLKKFKELGYNKIITTPHVMCDYYKNSATNILKGRDDVREELIKQGIDIEFEAAAEYNLDDGLEDLIAKKEILTFGDNYVLFELPFLSEPPNLQKVIFEFQMAGYKPVLAHPERYSCWYKTPEKYQELKSRGVLFQLNLLSLLGHYSPEVKKVAQKMVDNNLIDVVGTDCHRIEHLLMIADNLSLKHIHKLAIQENLLNKTV